MRTILLLTSLFLLGCSARTKNLAKTEDQTQFENHLSFNKNSSVSNGVSSVTDVRNFLISNGLKIKSTGEPYELRYGDVIFSGSADLEFSEKKEETLIHHVYRIHTTYITETEYKTKTNYQTKLATKDLRVNRSGISFGNLVAIIICSLVSGVVIWELLKRLIFKK